jgi:PAS domain S-box-containing protein
LLFIPKIWIEVYDEWARASPVVSRSRRRCFRRTDGEYRWFLSRAVPLRDKRRKVVKWYGAATDIQDRKLAEQERERLRQLEANLAHTPIE